MPMGLSSRTRELDSQQAPPESEKKDGRQPGLWHRMDLSLRSLQWDRLDRLNRGIGWRNPEGCRIAAGRSTWANPITRTENRQRIEPREDKPLSPANVKGEHLRGPMLSARPVIGCQIQLHPFMRPAVEDGRVHVKSIGGGYLPEPFGAASVLDGAQKNRPREPGKPSGESLRCDDALSIQALREAWRQRIVDFIRPCSHHGR